MAVADRFLRYVRIDTQSDPGSTSVPSTAKQKDLSTLLRAELEALGAEDVRMDEYGYVFASLLGTVNGPTIGLLAHVDTSFDAPGAGVQPIVHQRYDGGPLALPGDSSQVLDGTVDPALAAVAGHDLITSDGTTLLGSDDKAGVAII
ncbi:MAG: peptidase T, partial [Bacteroidota bacterium]